MELRHLEIGERVLAGLQVGSDVFEDDDQSPRNPVSSSCQV